MEEAENLYVRCMDVRLMDTGVFSPPTKKKRLKSGDLETRTILGTNEMFGDCFSHPSSCCYDAQKYIHPACFEIFALTSKLVGAQPPPCCSFARHLVGKMVIRCSFARH